MLKDEWGHDTKINQRGGRVWQRLSRKRGVENNQEWKLSCKCFCTYYKVLTSSSNSHSYGGYDSVTWSVQRANLVDARVTPPPLSHHHCRLIPLDRVFASPLASLSPSPHFESLQNILLATQILYPPFLLDHCPHVHPSSVRIIYLHVHLYL